ncbi:MAG: sulfite exporter TauE/SafE family protein, partial [Candidatus Nanoarchaeia archaeon]
MAFSASESVQTSELAANSELPVWLWPLLLFAGSFFLGIVAVLAGVGGGVLFVPFIGSVAPFNIDFIRCAGLIVALAGSISAAPSLLRKGLVSLRLAMPMALFAPTSSILGAMIGLALPSHIVQLLMGI